MRLPSFPTVIRTLFAFSNTTFRATAPRALSSPPRPLIQKSMQIPFLGALFGSSASQQSNMSHAVQKSSSEWQAQLSPGMSFLISQSQER